MWARSWRVRDRFAGRWLGGRDERAARAGMRVVNTTTRAGAAMLKAAGGDGDGGRDAAAAMRADSVPADVSFALAGGATGMDGGGRTRLALSILFWAPSVLRARAPVRIRATCRKPLDWHVRGACANHAVAARPRPRHRASEPG